jgi:hypothetical protein
LVTGVMASGGSRGKRSCQNSRIAGERKAITSFRQRWFESRLLIVKMVGARSGGSRRASSTSDCAA